MRLVLTGLKKHQQFTPAQPRVGRLGSEKNGDGIKIFIYLKMRSSQHKGRVSTSCDKKHLTVNIVVLALCSFVCPSVWILPGEFQLPGLLHEESLVGPCVWGSHGAFVRYRIPFLGYPAPQAPFRSPWLSALHESYF